METNFSGSPRDMDRRNRRPGATDHSGQIHGDIQPEVRIELDSGTMSVYRVRTKPQDTSAAGFLGSDNCDANLKVVWNWWRYTQSEFRYREAGEIDLGEIE